MKIEELVILGLTGAAAYLYWKMRSQKTAVVTQSITAPMTRAPVSTAIVPVDSAPPSMPTMPMPSLPEPVSSSPPTMPVWGLTAPGTAIDGPYIAESFPMAPSKECPFRYTKRVLSNGSYMCDLIQGTTKPGVGRWLDQTTYRLEMPPTRDIMPQFLMNPPECVKPTMASDQMAKAYGKCQYAKSEECRAKGGSVVMSEFEPMGPNQYGAKYGFCVDRSVPTVPTEVKQALNARCSLLHMEPMPQVFGKDPGHRHGQYQIWKCMRVEGA
jgi:hypothetical protein